MQIIKKINEIRKIIKDKKYNNKKIGFVPTMGALHQGHLSLIERSVKECDFTVVSIFVNPLQFIQGEDFKEYPRVHEKDLKLCEDYKTDLVFLPEADEMFGEDILTSVDIEKLGNNLCGLSRPGHFKGVCTIVAKFFNIVNADKAYFGKKDIQQLAIIKKMVADLNIEIEIIPCDIIRETDGLAMSSRNVYLSNDERKDAVIIYNSLKQAKDVIDGGESDTSVIIELIKKNINNSKFSKIDYVKIVNEKMEDVEKIRNGDIIACAVYFGKARLIDNYIVGEQLC